MKKRICISLLLALCLLVIPSLSLAVSPPDAPAIISPSTAEPDAPLAPVPEDPANDQPQPVTPIEEAAEEGDVSPAPTDTADDPAAYPGGVAHVTTCTLNPRTGAFEEVYNENLSDEYNYLPLAVGQTLARDASGNLVFYVQPTESGEYTLQMASDPSINMWSISYDSDINELIRLNGSDSSNVQYAFHLKAGEYYAFRGIGFASATITRTPATPLTLNKTQPCTLDRSALYSFTAPAAGRYMTQTTPNVEDDYGWADFLTLDNVDLGGNSVYLAKGERILVVTYYATSLTVKQVALYDDAQVLSAALIDDISDLEIFPYWDDDDSHATFLFGEHPRFMGTYTSMQKPYLVFDLSDTSATPRLLNSSGNEIALKTAVVDGTKLYYTPLSVKGSRRELQISITPEDGKSEIRYTLQINPPPIQPSRPTTCHARQSGTAVNLSWAPAQGADYYRIYRSDAKSKQLKHISTIDADQCSYTDQYAHFLRNPKYKIVPVADQYGRFTSGASSRVITVPGFRPTKTK